jgi:hypothetical protein
MGGGSAVRGEEPLDRGRQLGCVEGGRELRPLAGLKLAAQAADARHQRARGRLGARGAWLPMREFANKPANAGDRGPHCKQRAVVTGREKRGQGFRVHLVLLGGAA